MVSVFKQFHFSLWLINPFDSTTMNMSHPDQASYMAMITSDIIRRTVAGYIPSTRRNCRYVSPPASPIRRPHLTSKQCSTPAVPIVFFKSSSFIPVNSRISTTSPITLGLTTCPSFYQQILGSDLQLRECAIELHGAHRLVIVYQVGSGCQFNQALKGYMHAEWEGSILVADCSVQPKSGFHRDLARDVVGRAVGL